MEKNIKTAIEILCLELSIFNKLYSKSIFIIWTNLH